MALFKTDPLLAFCRLLAWLILIAVAGGGLFGLCMTLATLVNGDMVIWALRQSYPDLRDEGLRPVLGIGMALIAAAMALVARFLLHLLAIIGSVTGGEAFTLTNAGRIRAMAWLSLASMPAGIGIAVALGRAMLLLGPRLPDAGMRVAPPDMGLGYGQILLTLLLFVLARLFAQAAAMRDDIAGTI